MTSPERLINTTTSLCRVCREALPAQVVATAGGEVWMRKACPEHGPQEVRLSPDAAWYEATRGTPARDNPPPKVRRAVDKGCPYDCGPCTSHTQKVRLPVVTITSRCDLDCPICYVWNKNDDAFDMSDAEFQSTLEHLVRDHGGDLDLINLTGGEPVRHPRFLEFVEMAQKAGVHRVSVCSNGVRLARDEALVERLAAVNGRVALSFDTFDPDADRALQGAALLPLKLRCLDLLDKHDVDTTLIPVMTRGVNDHEIGRILELGFSRPSVRHIEVHTMTYTGQGGISFPRAGRISMIEVLRRIEETTAGLLRVADFVPSPCAHPLCYQIAYLLMDPAGGPPVPFLRFLDAATMRALLADRLYLEPSPRLERELREAIDRLWIAGDAESERILGLLSRLMRSLFPTDRALSRLEALRISERAVKAVYVHSHMDEETFDTERARECCDSNCYADGSTVPVCNYNVLYRDKEARFMARPRAWGPRQGGVRAFPKVSS